MAISQRVRNEVPEVLKIFFCNLEKLTNFLRVTLGFPIAMNCPKLVVTFDKSQITPTEEMIHPTLGTADIPKEHSLENIEFSLQLARWASWSNQTEPCKLH